MREETITAGDGRTVKLVVPPLPGQVWEVWRLEDQGPKLGAMLGLLLMAGGIITDGKLWRPRPLARFNGSFSEWGWDVYNSVARHTGWSPIVVDRLGTMAIAMAADTYIDAEAIEQAADFFSQSPAQKEAAGGA